MAPLTPPEPGDHDAIAPRVLVEGSEFRLQLLDMGAAPRSVLLQCVASAAYASEALTLALDIIFIGYPVGRPY